jgi:hypothetical protein
MQTASAVAACVVEYVLAGQGRQDALEPTTLEYCPSGHPEHDAAEVAPVAVDVEPAGHEVQESDAADAEYVPGAHGMQRGEPATGA